ncbi:MAG: hypothetical protein WCJ18_09470 [Planctomycetota bacterium]
MFALESIAALVTIFGGVAALLVWTFGRVATYKQENASLRAQLAAVQAAPRQPPGCDYLEDSEGTPLCIHCFSTAGQRWKLIKENGQQRCPVCGKVTAH